MPDGLDKRRNADPELLTIDGIAIAVDVIQKGAPPNGTIAWLQWSGASVIACAGSASGRVERLIRAEPSISPGMGRSSAHIAAQTEARFVERGYAASVHATERAAATGEDGARAFHPALRLASSVAPHRGATAPLQERSSTFRERLVAVRLPKAVIAENRASPLELFTPDMDTKGYVVPNAGRRPISDNPMDSPPRLRVLAAMSGRFGRGSPPSDCVPSRIGNGLVRFQRGQMIPYSGCQKSW